MNTYYGYISSMGAERFADILYLFCENSLSCENCPLKLVCPNAKDSIFGNSPAVWENWLKSEMKPINPDILDMENLNNESQNTQNTSEN